MAYHACSIRFFFQTMVSKSSNWAYPVAGPLAGSAQGQGAPAQAQPGVPLGPHV